MDLPLPGPPASATDPLRSASSARRSSTVALYRIAVLFVAAWALLATTALVWVIAEGGVGSVGRLAAAPGRLFTLGEVYIWLGGALGAFGIFLVAFVISQAVGRGLLEVLDPRPLDWPAGLAAPDVPVRLLTFSSAKPDAFTFALLTPSRRLPWRREEVIMVSDALLGALTPDEWSAVVAHELGHVRELDGRYLTFLRTFARLACWDPIVVAVASGLTRREEFRADSDAVALTHRPRALARAIYKASKLSNGRSSVLAGLLGPGGRWGRRWAEERIRRLVALAESGRFEDEPAQ